MESICCPESKLPLAKVLKWIGTCTLIHPVLAPRAQSCIHSLLGGASLLDARQGQALGTLLEALNLFVLVKGFDMQVFGIKKFPQIDPEFRYGLALWKNCLSSLTKNM